MRCLNLTFLHYVCVVAEYWSTKSNTTYTWNLVVTKYPAYVVKFSNVMILSLICDLILNCQHHWHCVYAICSVDRRHTKKWRHHCSRDGPRASACRLERWGHHKWWAKEYSRWWKEELHWGSEAGCSQVLVTCPLLPWQFSEQVILHVPQ